MTAMTDASTYGQADILIDDGGVRLWTTPVSALGPTLLVSLLIEGASEPEPGPEPANHPRVRLAARDSSGEWVQCSSAGGGGGGSTSSTVLYAKFDSPIPSPDELRLEVQHVEKVAVRMMPRIES